MAKKLETLIKITQIEVDRCLQACGVIEKQLQQLHQQTIQLQKFREEYQSALCVEHGSKPTTAEAIKRYTRLVAMLDHGLRDHQLKIVEARKQLNVARERYFAINRKLKSYQKIQDKDELSRQQQQLRLERRQMDAQASLRHRSAKFNDDDS